MEGWASSLHTFGLGIATFIRESGWWLTLLHGGHIYTTAIGKGCAFCFYFREPVVTRLVAYLWSHPKKRTEPTPCVLAKTLSSKPQTRAPLPSLLL